MNPITAIDILLEPDATMMKTAGAANARLRESFPKGFALDETHQPHITCLQRYVKTGDRDDRDRSSVRYHGAGRRHQPTDHRLRGGLRTQPNGQEIQPACEHWHRLP